MLRVDFPRLEEAQTDLGLRLDVRVMFERLKPLREADGVAVHGRYTGVDAFHAWHNVWVHKYLTTAAANAALWHELVHALQCERIGSYPRFDSEYRRQQRDVPALYGTSAYYRLYRCMPYEQEAWAHTELAREGVLAKLVYAED